MWKHLEYEIQKSKHWNGKDVKRKAMRVYWMQNKKEGKGKILSIMKAKWGDQK